MAGAAPPVVRLQLCTGKTCRREGNATAVLAVLRKLAPPDAIQLTTASCLSRCGAGPHLVLRDSGQELSMHACDDKSEAVIAACLHLLRGVGLSADELERVEQRAGSLLAPQG